MDFWTDVRAATGLSDGLHFAVLVEAIHGFTFSACTIYYLILDRIPAMDKFRIRFVGAC